MRVTSLSCPHGKEEAIGLCPWDHTHICVVISAAVQEVCEKKASGQYQDM